MNTNTSPGLRPLHVALILALGLNLALWSLAGLAFSAEFVQQAGGAGADRFGLLQWKAS